MGKINNFEDLEVWQLSIDLAKDIYQITLITSFNRDFSLIDQIRRATVSISSNISEGFERNYNKEFIRFLRISKASAGEVRSQIYLAKELGYINEDNFNRVNNNLLILSKKLGRLIKYLINK